VTRELGLILAFLGMVSLLVKGCWMQSVEAATEPELPLLYVDTADAPSNGRTIAVPAGGDFQAALNIAAPGDVIALEAGATFTVRNQDGTAPWSTVEDVTFSNNIVRHTGSAVGHARLGRPLPEPAHQAHSDQK